LKYIPTICTSTTNITLDWANFTKFYEFFISNEELETYALENYVDPTHFLISWYLYQKHIFVLLVGPKQTPPIAWRLGPRRIGLK
jgi:hypothetical protein